MNITSPDKYQKMDISLSILLAEVFLVVVYSQIILNQCKLKKSKNIIMNHIINSMEHDLSRFVLHIIDMYYLKENHSAWSIKIVLKKLWCIMQQYIRFLEKNVFEQNGV